MARTRGVGRRDVRRAAPSAVIRPVFTGALQSAGGRLDGLLATIPFYPLILAAYPVLLLYSNNVAEVAPSEVASPLVQILIVTTFGYAALALVWRSPRRAAIVVSAVAVPFLSFGFVVAAIWSAWPQSPLIRSQLLALLAWILVVALAVSVAARLDRSLPSLTQALNVVAVVLLVLVVSPVARFAMWPAGPPNTDATTSAYAVTAYEPDGRQRDIYHFVFDRYGSEEGLRVGPGIDNSDFVDWLRATGFQVVDGARANYWRTLPSMSSVFGMSLHDDLAQQMGAENPNPQPLIHLLRNNRAAATLQTLGYRYLHVGVGGLYGRSDIADHVEPPGFEVTFASTLHGNTAIGFLTALLTFVTAGSDESLKGYARSVQRSISFAEAMAGVEGPKFVYAHFFLPHRPYVFLEDGTIAPDQASYETQLRFANSQIRRLVEPLLALPEDEQPIIIVQADEGPYPERYDQDWAEFEWATATDEELLTKFGVISAWYLPGPEGEADLGDEMSLVNTYPELLQRYFGADIPRAPDRSYIPRANRLYDHVDVTDRLLSARLGVEDDVCRTPDASKLSEEAEVRTTRALGSCAGSRR